MTPNCDRILYSFEVKTSGYDSLDHDSLQHGAAIGTEDGIALDAVLAALSTGEKRDGGSKYHRIVAAFSECILSGTFRPGQRVPAETALAGALSLSVGTVRQALGDLAASGLIVRYRRNGTFIADRSTQVSEVFVYRFKDPETGRFQLPFVRTDRVVLDDRDGPWRSFMRADRLVRMDRLVWFDGEPPAYSSVYFQERHGGVLLDRPVETLNSASVHRLLIDRFGLPTMRMAHAVSCGTLPDEVAGRLMLRAGALGLVWDIRDRSVGDDPVLFHRYYLPPGHRPIEIEETMTAPARAPNHRSANRRGTERQAKERIT